MDMAKFRHLTGILTVAMCLAGTAACSNIEPGDPEVDADPVKKGPGIFSGRSGSWKVLGR